MCQCIYLCVTDSQGRKHLGVPFPSCCGKSAVKELLVSAQWLDECHYQCLRDSVIFLILAAIGSPDASCNFSHQVLSQGRKEREGKPWLYLFLFSGKAKALQALAGISSISPVKILSHGSPLPARMSGKSSILSGPWHTAVARGI